MPSLSFLGGAGSVTGSRFLVEHDHRRVLVDAGMFQGPRELRAHNWSRFQVDPATIDAVVVTHAHLDHVGYLPVLARDGFRGPVVVTRRTAQLGAIVLADSARLHEEDAAFANRRGFSKHHPALPLYTSEDATRAVGLFHVTPFRATVPILDGWTVHLRPAGHILGSATVELGVGDLRIGFTGDLGRPSHPLLTPPDRRPDVDVVVTESTYGDREHEPLEAALGRMAEVIRRTAARGGTVVIPSFAVDRTEVVLLALHRLVKEGAIPDLPIHVDSPMALEVLDVYRAAIADGDVDIRADADVSGMTVHTARTIEESKALNDIHYPSIIVSASGMATGGRILHHLAARLPDTRNTVVLVGFQAAGTRGRSLQEGAREVRMHGHEVPVRAEVVSVDAFSVHADAHELVAWHRDAPPPKESFVVHGEPDAADALASRLHRELGWAVSAPARGDRVTLAR